MRRLLGLLLPLRVAVLAAGIGASPPAIYLETDPGARFQGILRIYPLGGEVLRVRIEPVDWWTDAEGNPTLFPAGTLPRSLAPWLETRPRTLILERERVLRFSGALPRNAEGSYFLGLLLRPGRAFQAEAGIALGFRQSLLVPLVVTARGRGRPGLELTGVRLEGNRLTALIRNSGNLALRFDARWVALGPGGEVLAEGPLDADLLLPGGARRLSAMVPQAAALVRLHYRAEGLPERVREVYR